MNITYLIAFFIFGILAAGSFIYAANVSKNEAYLRQRLNEFQENEINFENGMAKNIEDLPLSERIFYPFVVSLSKFMIKITPSKQIEKLEDMIIKAGSPKKMSALDFLGIQGVFTLFIPIVMSALMIISGSPISKIIIIFVVTALVGRLLPKVWLNSQIKKRKQQIERMLPFSLDLLNISVSAGLGFDAAMDKVATTLEGPMADEFAIVLKEIQLGKDRKDALRNMVDRTDVKDLSQFVVTIIQSEKLGVGLGRLLKTQSEQMRANAKQRAQEKAMKAPIKMLFPIMFFIFPSIFIILLGPALLYLPKIFETM